MTTSASAAVIKSVNKDSLKATMSNAISPLDDSSAKDYDKRDSRALFLVDNYSQSKNGADSLRIQDFSIKAEVRDREQKQRNLSKSLLLSEIPVLN